MQRDLRYRVRQRRPSKVIFYVYRLEVERRGHRGLYRKQTLVSFELKVSKFRVPLVLEYTLKSYFGLYGIRVGDLLD